MPLHVMTNDFCQQRHGARQLQHCAIKRLLEILTLAALFRCILTQLTSGGSMHDEGQQMLNMLREMKKNAGDNGSHAAMFAIFLVSTIFWLNFQMIKA